jgi:hypothetical protein
MPVATLVQEVMVNALVLACEKPGDTATIPALTERDDIELVRVTPRPGKAELDPVFARLDGRRLVVAGNDADLAAVVLRLMRAERLADVPIGFVATAASRVAALWGLPRDTGRAAELALAGDIDPLPLIRDDVGGVLVGAGVIRGVRGVAYCDDEPALRGQAGRIEVTPDPTGGAGLLVEVTKTGLLGKRTTAFHGRAFQLGCVPTTVVRDDVAHDRLVSRWTWYRHTQDLRAVRGLL